MTPTPEAFLLRFRHALTLTAARPLVELWARLPSLASIAESVRLSAAAADPDFWGHFATAAGEEDVARALRVLQQGAWQVDRVPLRPLAVAVCAGLHA